MELVKNYVGKILLFFFHSIEEGHKPQLDHPRSSLHCSTLLPTNKQLNHLTKVANT